MKLDISAYSHHGGKSENQDRYAIFHEEKIAYQQPFHKEIAIDELGIALCDGISAFKNAAKGAEKCIDTICSLGIDRFDEWVESCNQEVSKIRSGCTLVGARIQNGYFEFVNVGDSLLYYIRNNEIYQLAQLHTVAQTKKLQKIEVIEERDYHTLVCYIGDRKSTFKGYRNKVKLRKDDRIIVCSDGLSEILDENDLLQSKESALDLIRAVKKETSDNVTVVVIDVLDND